ncbi:MAG: alanine--tRNA ligase [Verrucomicrobia bacterium 13_1_20CM_54_28]|nr:MAG: alanine--tRNA ligase [Verrucomicrobia bacterium 13_1_20CM_54_28]OLE10713.1 MAG: alanine--tRNA ligase [Verrucomicrobia bacterium 13_1_20CM_3_54_17]
MTSAQIRQSFLDFFREKQHTIVPSSSLLPDSPNLLFTNAGMNQFVPIFLGQQKAPWKPARVADTQKCIRAGGKHNDLEDVGLDTYHHTFFEMLGNWSFGDYFKKEAIQWAWELLVERWKFPAQRLYATVYQPGPGEPSEFDQEAYNHWAHLFREADLDPKVHVLNGGRADNFWMMGDTGPCGPCSEVHVDLTPDGDTRGALVNKGDPRCIEIWNLVFIQFNANPDGTFSPLPQRHVDTGMGFERVTAIIQDTKTLTDFFGTISNYETDIFRPIFDELEKLSTKKYGSTLPTEKSGCESEQEKIDIAFRVIADHIRALSFAIADGIIPSNEGRGYVLRRILRRAVRYGRTLGFHEPFFFKLADVVARTMGDVFPEIRTKQSRIKETIEREEEAFSKTLDAGLEHNEAIVRAKRLIAGAAEKIADISPEKETEASRIIYDAFRGASRMPGDREVLRKSLSTEEWEFFAKGEKISTTTPQTFWEMSPEEAEGFRRLAKTALDQRFLMTGAAAFLLYDTYGFPLDLTELMAREQGFTVDVAGFEKLMEEQRERARKTQKKEEISIEEGELKAEPTKFLGYDFLETESVVETVLPGTKPEELNIVLDRTPLYAEMGGQVGDHGLLHVPGHDRTEVGQLRVIDTQKRGEVFVHRAALVEGRAPEPGEAVRVSVDADRRRAIQGHHTVTHLLHWALHEVVSRDASQKGSYVGPHKLTFDFSSAPLTKQQVRDVEKLVNEKIAENAPVSWTEIPYAEAKQRTDIIQFFGEKYGDKVRVLQIGGSPRALNGYSMELCGGTHVRSTGEIGPFRIVKEEAIAAGIRRIEAVAGDAARGWANQEAARQQEKFEALVRKKPDIAPMPVFKNDATTSEMLQPIDARAAHLEKIEVEVRDWEKQSAKTAETELRSGAAQVANELAASHAGKDFCVAEVQNGDGKLLQAVVDALKSKFKGPIFLVGATNESVALVASVPKEMSAKLQANKLIQQIAPIVGGKGGGRPENAQGAGKDASKIAEALAKARELLS